MEHTYQYLWIMPFVLLPLPMLIGGGLLLFPESTKKLRRIWAFSSISLLSIVFLFSINLSIQQINSSSIYQYIWLWTLNNDFSLEFGHLIDPLTSILLILITTVGIFVLIYSESYMSYDQGYLRFFAYLSFFNTSMLGLVTSSNLIQIYLFWELVGMCSYLLIGFWFTRPIASNACQKAFVTNRVGDFGFLLGILGLYWLTGSFEFQDLFEIVQIFIFGDEFSPFFLTLFAFLLFLGAIAKSAQFPLHVWLPDAMEGPTPISALIHAATMVAAGIFLVARLLPLFLVIPYIMNFIIWIGIITIFLGASLALAQKDIKRCLAYSTMSQLGYMMLALGMGSYRAALFHLITHAYSKALLFLGSGSIIHSMEGILGYSPDKSQNMVLMGGLTKRLPITKISFFVGTLSLCGIPPLACFWSKDEILNQSWLYSPIFAIIASSTGGLTAFYMFRVFLLTFEGHFNPHFQNYCGKKKSTLYSLSLWGKEREKRLKKKFPLLASLTMNNSRQTSFFWKKRYQIDGTLKKGKYPFLINPFGSKSNFSYPQESDNTMLFPIFVLALFTSFFGVIGIPFNQFYLGGIDLDILSKLLSPALTLLHLMQRDSLDFYEFLRGATLSTSIVLFGIFMAFFFYNPLYSSLQNLKFLNLFVKKGPKRLFWDPILNMIYDWSYNRGYIDTLYTLSLNESIIKGLVKLTLFFDRRIIDGITNAIGLLSFFLGESIKYVGGGRISSYLLVYFFCMVIDFLILLIFS